MGKLTMKRSVFMLGVLLAALVLLGHEAYAQWPGIGKGVRSHMNSKVQKRGCAACHAGRGVVGTPLLKSSKEDLCFQCHGISSRRWAKADIEIELTKLSTHPINETSQYHSLGEVLPEDRSTARRHVACYDCHVVHISEPERAWMGARGYSPGVIRGNPGGGPPQGFRSNRTESVYEMCYICHSDSANLPVESKNIAVLMNPDNPSYHPVEFTSRNHFVPSLVRALSPTTQISCLNCHGNDDPSGPKGPHGSNYSPLLVAEYRTDDGFEEPKAYELCYLCHERASILGDDSFQRHRLHIVEQGTSCNTCHNAHGSVYNMHLISFDEENFNVLPSANSGGPIYLPFTPGMPRCYLNCHGVEHNATNVGDNPWPWSE